ncbi:MAG: hypothetical protein K8R46_03770, partial [Pirellulales bacterium]|nr:hypothetical protein [Pirellulales bacterium]
MCLRTPLSTPRFTSVPIVILLGVCLWTALAAEVSAGGGPENVLLVVNPRSPTSMTIANHYIHLRSIPAGNVLQIPWDPDVQKTDVETFRHRILEPVLKAISQRKREGQIDYVVYSSDFPWGINLHGDVKKHLERTAGSADGPKAKTNSQEKTKRRLEQMFGDKKKGDKSKWPKMLTQVGSINGLTYLWEPVMEGNPGYIGLSTNWYMHPTGRSQQEVTTLAFSHRLRFGAPGKLVESKGRRYLLSVVLGITASKNRRGSTLAEVVGYLRRSAAADGTHPQGTIYFAKNNDIRSKVRAPFFPTAVEQLAKLGVAAAIVEGNVPKNKRDAQGVMMGVAGFKWEASKSTILPGAICDHLTSTGGVMSSGASQTPLTEFLRHGAAGASGAVTEPYAILAKFPHPMMHVHYARGCTLAEAFYQSVFGPYQLLIVGDPLCRPWATIPEVKVRGVQPRATVRDRVTLIPHASIAGSGKVNHFELFVDGRRRGRCEPGGELVVETNEMTDGYHELRIVAVAAGPIHTQGCLLLPITCANHGRRIEVSHTPRQTVRVGRSLTIRARSPGAKRIDVWHHWRKVGTIQGPTGVVKVDEKVVGAGPVRLHVVATHGAGPQGRVVAKPVEVV